MFEIGFTEDEPELQKEGWYGLWGQTVLGDYHESFLAPIGPWSRRDYERHWLEAGERLLGEQARSGFFTQAHRFWWVMWRQDGRVLVQERYIIPELAERITDLSTTPWDLIGECYESAKEAPVSQWRLRANDIREFLDRNRMRPMGT